MITKKSKNKGTST